MIAGLEAGADDYVTKPLVASELAARIRALPRRRRSDLQNAVYPMGDVEIRPDEGVARRAGADLRLTKTEFRLLAELATAEGPVVTREQLLRAESAGTTGAVKPGCRTFTSAGCAARSNLIPTLPKW